MGASIANSNARAHAIFDFKGRVIIAYDRAAGDSPFAITAGINSALKNRAIINVNFRHVPAQYSIFPTFCNYFHKATRAQRRARAAIYTPYVIRRNVLRFFAFRWMSGLILTMVMIALILSCWRGFRYTPRPKRKSEKGTLRCFFQSSLRMISTTGTSCAGWTRGRSISSPPSVSRKKSSDPSWRNWTYAALPASPGKSSFLYG